MTTLHKNTVLKMAVLLAGVGIALTSFGIAPAKAQTVTTTTTLTFTRNLTIGSRGADVISLQTWLISKGYSIPAGATGYFGVQTRAAVASYQVAKGIIPPAGYFGPITRGIIAGDIAGGGSTSTVPGCAPGALYSSTTGASCKAPTSTVPGCFPGALYSPTTGQSCTSSNSGSTNGITTIGVEGSINIEKESAGIRTTIYEGDVKAPLLGVRIEAKDSDVNFSRVRVNLGTTTDSYNRQFSRVYLIDDTRTVLASRDLNSTSVTRVSGSPTEYYVTLSGFNSLIKKNMKRSYTVAFDAYPSISSTYRTGSYTMSFYGSDAIRVTDGAGLDQYSTGANNITQTFNISANLSDSALLTVSTDPAVRKATTIVANQGANNNEKDKEEIGSFRLLAEKDDVLLRDINVTVSNTATSSASVQTLYLYDGSTAIATASGDSNGIFHFTSINQSISRDAYKTITIKADFRSVTSGAVVKVGAVTVVSAESKGSGRTLTTLSTLSAGAGEAMNIVANGVAISAASPSINIVTSKDTNGNTTEAHLSATYNMTITAVGSDATFGAPATAFTFVLLKNGQATTTSGLSSRVVYYPATQPTGTTGYSATGFTIPRNATVTVPVTFKLDSNNAAAVASDFTNGDYSVRLNTVTYTTTAGTVSNDYSTNVNYVTPSFTRP